MSRRAERSRWLRLLVAVLSLVVGLGVMLPVYARMLGGPKPHACHCDTGRGHAHCECPICFPDLEPSIDSLVVSLQGRCGDDDTGWRTYAEPAVAPAGLTAIVIAVPRSTPVRPLRDLLPRSNDPPDPRPPRSFIG